MNKSARLLEKFKKWPAGLWLFTRALCFKAPYFSTIRPTFTLLEPGRGEARMVKRRSVLNHLGTVHAIAMANLCELVAGTTLEVTVPPTHRWIPKSMNIKYLAKAQSNLTAKTHIAIEKWPEAGTENVHVEVFDARDTLVVSADIEMYISKKR